MLLLNIKMPVLCRKKDGGSTFSHDRHTKTNHNGAKKALFFAIFVPLITILCMPGLKILELFLRVFMSVVNVSML